MHWTLEMTESHNFSPVLPQRSIFISPWELENPSKGPSMSFWALICVCLLPLFKITLIWLFQISLLVLSSGIGPTPTSPTKYVSNFFYLGSFQTCTMLDASWVNGWFIFIIQWGSMNSSLIFYHDHCFAHLLASVPTPFLQCQFYFHCLRYFNFAWLLVNQTGFPVMGLNAEQKVGLTNIC